MKQALFIGVIASALTFNNAIAEGGANEEAGGSGVVAVDNNPPLDANNVVAAKSYVDESVFWKENKMPCAGWPDGTTVYNSTHTNANCWLWRKVD